MQKNSDAEIERLLTQGEVAARWGCSKRKLQRLRTVADGPTYVRLGSSIRYLLSDILQYENQNRMRGNQ